jgi:RNA polymerase sigma-70 factor (ECF subfamily)
MLKVVARKTGTVDPPGRPAGLGEIDEGELISRCRAGERVAQDELYHRFRRPVAANLYRVLGDRTDLDDLVQEVFVIAFRGLDTFRGDARLSTWLYRVCVNVALGRIRSRTRRPPPVGGVDLDGPGTSSLVDQPETPERALERAEDRARVYRALEKLPPKKRIVLYLHEIEGRDLKDIAYLVDSNPVTVRTRLFYARREFYQLLAQDGTGDVPVAAPPTDAATGSGDEEGES